MTLTGSITVTLPDHTVDIKVSLANGVTKMISGGEQADMSENSSIYVSTSKATTTTNNGTTTTTSTQVSPSAP